MFKINVCQNTVYSLITEMIAAFDMSPRTKYSFASLFIKGFASNYELSFANSERDPYTPNCVFLAKKNAKTNKLLSNWNLIRLASNATQSFVSITHKQKFKFIQMA